MSTFVLRSPNGPHKGEYFKQGDYEGIEWATLDGAKRFGWQDCYGNMAAALDMLAEVLVPEAVNATEEDRQKLADRIATDMWQNPGPELRALCLSAIRPSADAPLHDLPPEFPPRKDPGYCSVWEWLARATPLKASG